MSKLKQLVWIGLLLSWSSCNRYTDQQPTPDSGPPASTVQALTQRYPQAQDILFTTIANNQLWQANFVQQRQRYQALFSSTRMLTADQLIDGGVPDSLTHLLEATVVAGGTVGNPRLRQYDWYTQTGATRVTRVYADYTWQQQAFTVSWTITRLSSGKITYYLELLPFQSGDYQTDTQAEIPQALQTALREQGLTLTYAWIQLGALRQQRGTLSVQKQGQQLYLSYDEDGQPLAVSNQQTAQFFQQLNQLPPAIQQYLQRPELVGFGLQGADASLTRHSYGSLSTYRVSLQNGNQAWLMTFSDKGQLISRSFLTYGVF